MPRRKTRWHKRVSNPRPLDLESYALPSRYNGWTNHCVAARQTDDSGVDCTVYITRIRQRRASRGSRHEHGWLAKVCPRPTGHTRWANFHTALTADEYTQRRPSATVSVNCCQLDASLGGSDYWCPAYCPMPLVPSHNTVELGYSIGSVPQCSRTLLFHWFRPTIQ